MGQKVVQKVRNHCFWRFWTHFLTNSWIWLYENPRVFSKIVGFEGSEPEGPKSSKNDLFSLFFPLFATLFELGKCRNDQKMGQKVEKREKVEKRRKIDDFDPDLEIPKKLVAKSDFLEGSKNGPFWWTRFLTHFSEKLIFDAPRNRSIFMFWQLKSIHVKIAKIDLFGGTFFGGSKNARCRVGGRPPPQRSRPKLRVYSKIPGIFGPDLKKWPKL